MLLRTVIITLLAAASGGAASTAPPPIVFAADNEPALSGDSNGKQVAFVSERGGGPGSYESRNRRRWPAAPRPATAPDRWSRLRK